MCGYRLYIEELERRLSWDADSSNSGQHEIQLAAAVRDHLQFDPVSHREAGLTCGASGADPRDTPVSRELADKSNQHILTLLRQACDELCGLGSLAISNLDKLLGRDVPLRSLSSEGPS